MFLLKSDFRKDIVILLIASIILGTLLVLGGGYLADNYFVNMVSTIIGDYGEYDLLFTISSDKEEIALEQIREIAEKTLPGSKLKAGPKVIGSSNYLLKIPEEYKREEIYINLGKYFSDIPGLISRTIMTEPRLSIRGFRGRSRSFIRPLIEEIEGIDFIYPTSDGFDIIVEKQELLPEVRKKINEILKQYKLLEIRYPLNQHPEELSEKAEEIISVLSEDLPEVINVTENNNSGQVSLLSSLRQMKTFLLSYASKVVIEGLENSYSIASGNRLVARAEDGRYLELKVIDNKNGQITAIIQQGALEDLPGNKIEVFYSGSRVTQGEKLGDGFIHNPRQDLAHTLNRLTEITPVLNDFIAQSEQLVDYSEKIDGDFAEINHGLSQLQEISGRLNSSLIEWQQEGLSGFLEELLLILDDIKNNVGDISDIKKDLIQTSNKLKEGAGLIEERLIYVPRSNSIYEQLFDLKEVFLQISKGLDEQYDLVTERMKDMDPVLSSIENWQTKINSLLKVEAALNSGANWQEVDSLISQVEDTVSVFDTKQLQERLLSIQEILLELKSTQISVVLNQLSYIQNSLPDMKEEEIVETINLIDRYIAGEVIPGDQIQLLIKGSYDSKKVINVIKRIIANPAVNYIEMDAGLIQTNPRTEVFNLLRQVKALISVIIAFIFTVFLLIMDHSLIISILRLNHCRASLYGFFTGAFLFSMICLITRVDFPYLNLLTEIAIGGISGLLVALLSNMLNPVNNEEWEAGVALGFSPAEIMHEIIIPAGKPGLLYLLNYPKIIFKG